MAVGGGAAFESFATLTNTTFSNNSSHYKGGGAFFYEYPATLSRVVFNGNTTKEDGAGAYFSENVPVAGNSVEFIQNTSGRYGGGVWFGGAAALTYTLFASNTASLDGGGAYFNGAYFSQITSISTTTFTNNIAVRYGGGALISNGGYTSRISGTRFFDNVAQIGAGIYLSYSNLSVVNTVFAANHAVNINGSADIEFGGNWGSELNGIHNTFVSASRFDTSIYAGRGRSDQFVLTNSIFAGYVTGLNIGNNIYSARLAGVLWDSVDNPTIGNLNMTLSRQGPACFVDPLVKNYLAVGSGVDAGFTSNVPVDIDGTLRPQGAGFDVGAYEAIMIARPNDVNLCGFMLSNAVLVPAFISNTFEYSSTVSSNESSILVIPVANNRAANVRIRAIQGDSESVDCNDTCPIIIGRNLIRVVVTSPDESSTLEYDIHLTVNKPPTPTPTITPTTSATPIPTTTPEPTIIVPCTGCNVHLPVIQK